MIARFTKGPRSVVARLNEMIAEISRLGNDMGAEYRLDHQNTPIGRVGALGINRVIPDVPKFGMGRSSIRKAYCKTAAGAGTTLACYLDTDATGDEVTVNFSIMNGSNLNAATPRLTDGGLIFVYNDAGTWRCIAPFQATEDCVCS